MSSLSQRVYDYDTTFMNQINIKGPQNTIIPSQQCLTSDGQGNAFWSTATFSTFIQGSTNTSTFGFNRISFPNATYSSDLSYNSFTFGETDYIGFTPSSMYSKSFTEFATPTQFSLSNATNTLLSTVRNFINISSLYGSFSISTFSTTNTILLQNTKAYNQTFVIQSNVSDPVNNISTLPWNQTISTLQFAAIGGLSLSTNTGQNLIALRVQSFTSSGFRLMEITASTMSTTTNNTLRMISSYVYITNFSSGISTGTAQSSLSTLIDFYSSLISITTPDQGTPFSTNTMNMLERAALSTVNILSTTTYSNYTFATTYSTLSTTIGIQPSTFVAMFSSILSSVAFPGYQYSTMTSAVSTQLYTMLVPQTIASTNSILSQTLYTLPSGDTVKNLCQTLVDISGATWGNIANTVQSTQFISYSSNVLQTLSTAAISLSTFSTTFRLRSGKLLYSSVTYTVLNHMAVGGSTPMKNVSSCYDLQFSSCSFFIQPFLRYITSNSRVFFEYSPNFAFSNTVPFSSLGVRLGDNAYEVSSFFQYNEEVINASVISDTANYVFKNPVNIPFSQSYAPVIRTQVPTDFLLRNNLTPYVMTHQFRNILLEIPSTPTFSLVLPNPKRGTVNANTSNIGFTEDNRMFYDSARVQTRNNTPARNALFITILDANF